MDKSSSSKVTVELHDPSGIFPLLRPELTSRLPLRNLNWKSPSRPLRNINALHVDFVSDAVTSAGGTNGSHFASMIQGTPELRSDSPSLSANGGAGAASRERRHQIPGLRETAYLKVFVLRCDDKDQYRAEYRSQLKEWVKSLASLKSSTSALTRHDNHDAFQWMIIHVVFPDTQAASEPRWTAAKNDPDELAERSKSKTKWAPGSNATVFDKIRADFNTGSKSDLEKVAQIRLTKRQVPPELLPRVAVPSEFHETAQQQESAWQDLISKFKTLILRSFDQRVTQFEEDIREREAQRTLPGWNFCTFFTSKEGLARGFESVGLVEDALSIYDELAVGLDTIVNDDTALLGDMSTLRQELLDVASGSTSTDGDSQKRTLTSQLLDSPLDLYAKDYRSLIVSSRISLFDFHTYIFSRQRLLIYRLGSFEPRDGSGSATTQTQTNQKTKPEEQLFHVAEVCRRAASFIAANTRVFRKEMTASAKSEDTVRYDMIVQSVAASWAFVVSEKILAETSVSLVYAPSSPVVLGTGDASPSLGQDIHDFPTRRSSLRTLPHSSASPKGNIGPDSDRLMLSGDKNAIRAAPSGSGLSELSAHRGQLCLLQRRFLESLAIKNGWVAGWTSIINAEFDTDHQGKSGRSISVVAQADEQLKTSLDSDLLDALKSEELFRSTYEVLTDLAVRHLMLGNRTTTVDNLLGDLAILKYQNGDVTGAAQILARLTPKYLATGWNQIEARLLRIYTRSLRRLNRKDEYVRTMLALLKKNASQRARSSVQPTNEVHLGLDQADMETVSVAELLDFSKECGVDFKASFNDLFENLSISKGISHRQHQDGFHIELSFNSLLAHSATIDQIRLKLVSTEDDTQEIWLQTAQPVITGTGTTTVQVETGTSAWGLYYVRQVIFELERISFVHEYNASPSQQLFGPLRNGVVDGQMPEPTIMIYPRHGAMSVRLQAYPQVHMDKQRSIRIEVEPGNLPYDEILLRVRPATAGLRLETGQALRIDDPEQVVKLQENAFQVRFSEDKAFVVKLPYTLESSSTSEIVLKAQITCMLGDKEFLFVQKSEVSTDLLLDVDVNDTFQTDALFSRFSIRTIDPEPLILRRVQLSGSSSYDVETLPCSADMPLFGAQPFSLAARITRSNNFNSGDKSSSQLMLDLGYVNVTAMISHRFGHRLAVDLAGGPHIAQSGLLLPVLEQLLEEALDVQALEMAMLQRVYSLPSFEDLGWADYLRALPTGLASDLTEWLKKWHGTEGQIVHMTSLSDVPDLMYRTLTIPVDVPSVDILAKVIIKLADDPDSAPKALPRIAAVGQAMSISLSISFTRAWSATAKEAAEQQLMYVISETSDWLIAGPTMHTFTAREHEVLSFPLMLIPLISGTLLLPNVNVQCVGSPAAAAAAASTSTPKSPNTAPLPQAGIPRSMPKLGGTKSNSSSITCETEYESAGVTVLVTRTSGDAEVTILDAPIAASSGVEHTVRPSGLISPTGSPTLSDSRSMITHSLDAAVGGERATARTSTDSFGILGAAKR